jgi:hypothetical protein
VIRFLPLVGADARLSRFGGGGAFPTVAASVGLRTRKVQTHPNAEPGRPHCSERPIGVRGPGPFVADALTTLTRHPDGSVAARARQALDAL